MRRLTQSTLGASLALAVVLVLMLLAFLWPERLWGINFQTFVPIYLSGFAIALAMGTAMLLHRYDGLAVTASNLPTWLLSAGLALVMAALFYNFPNQTKLYGDSYTILKSLGPGGQESASKH